MENLPHYGRWVGQATSLAGLMLLGDYPPEAKDSRLVNLVQVGIDYWGLIQHGHPGWQGWGGHGSGRKFPIVFAGLMLGDDEMASPTKAFPKVEFGEDNQTMYGEGWTGAKALFAGHSGIQSATGKSERTQVGPYEHLHPSQWTASQEQSEGYRRTTTSCCWVGQALALRLLGAEKLWNHDAFFDYVDRWMTEPDDAQHRQEIMKHRPSLGLSDQARFTHQATRVSCSWTECGRCTGRTRLLVRLPDEVLSRKCTARLWRASPRFMIGFGQGRLRTVQDIAEWRLCLGCGACAYVCPERRVRLVDMLSEGVRPQVEAGDCNGCTACLQTCPAYENNHESSAPQAGILHELEPGFGPVLEAWEGYAADPEIRHLGASGGVITALALYCLEKEAMHGVLHIGPDATRPSRNQTRLSRTRKELLSNTGSRYGPASACDRLDLMESAPAACVFIGQPSEAAALRKACRLKPPLASKVGLVISFFCAGSPAELGTLDLLRDHGIDPAAVVELRYRGRGWPGMFAVRRRGESE